MSKIKIGFEITDMWIKEDYRNVIYALQDNPQKIDKRLTAGDVELFLISTDDSSTYIWATGARIGLDTDHTIACLQFSTNVTGIFLIGSIDIASLPPVLYIFNSSSKGNS